MYPLSDKDLDRISREAAEQTDMDQSPSGWEKLERRLEKELPQEKEKDRRRFLWIFFWLLLLSGGGSAWFYLSRQHRPDSPVSSFQPTISPNTERGNTTAPNKPNHSTGEKTGKEEIESQEPNIHSNAINDTPNSPPAGESEKNAKRTGVTPPNSQPSHSGNDRFFKEAVPTSPEARKQTQKRDPKNALSDRRTYASNKNRMVSSSEPPSTTANPIPASKNPGYSPVMVPAKEKTEEITSVPAPTTAKTTSPVTATDTPDVNHTDSFKPKPTAEAPSTTKSAPAGASKYSRWSFAITTGLDYTNIHGRGTSKLGYNLGLQASFNITRRLSVNTGILFTKKFYKADSSGFHPPKHYFTYYVDQLNWVDGHCYMWDIPLNIRYDIFERSGSRWYINAGMTSYIMRKQQYTYEYVYNSVASTRHWETKSQQNEWFKIINLGIGWEKQLSRSWSLQAEPFIKLPVTGVGFGKMDMNTSGILLSVRYRPKIASK